MHTSAQGLHCHRSTVCTCCKVGAGRGARGWRRGPSQELLWRHELSPAAVCGGALRRSCLGIYHRSARCRSKELETDT